MADCPIDCGRPVNPGRLMCPACWSLVPKPLQRAVYAAWAKYRKFTGLEQSPQRRQARLDYQAARDAAITSITGQEA